MQWLISCSRAFEIEKIIYSVTLVRKNTYTRMFTRRALEKKGG